VDGEDHRNPEHRAGTPPAEHPPPGLRFAGISPPHNPLMRTPVAEVPEVPEEEAPFMTFATSFAAPFPWRECEEIRGHLTV